METTETTIEELERKLRSAESNQRWASEEAARLRSKVSELEAAIVTMATLIKP